MSKALKTALALAAIAGTAGMAHAATTHVWVDNPYIPGLRAGNYFTQVQVQSISGTSGPSGTLAFCTSEGIVPGAILAGNTKVNTALKIKGVAVTTGSAPSLTITTTYTTTAKASKELLTASYVQNEVAVFGAYLDVPIECTLPPLPVGMAISEETSLSATQTAVPAGWKTYVGAGLTGASPVQSPLTATVAAGTFAGKSTCTGSLPANTAGTAYTAPTTVFSIAQNPHAPLTGNFTMSADSNFAFMTQNVLFALPKPTIGTGGSPPYPITYTLTNACDATIGVVFNRIGHN
jgi:hypothetical protein